MRRNRVQWIAFALGITLLLPIQAISRNWTSKKGQQIVAEYVMDSGGTVTLKKANGKKIRVKINALCEEDQIFIYDKKFPKFEVVPDLNMDRIGKYYQQTENISFDVAIKKKTQRPYVGSLKVHACVIGRYLKDDILVILDTVTDSFDLNLKDGSHFVFSTSGSPVSLTYNSDSDWGIQYEGFLVSVVTDDGKLVACKGSRPLYEKNWKKLSELKKDMHFSKKMKVYPDRHRMYYN